MRYQMVLYTDEDGVWISECPVLPGCVSQGHTRDEALVNIQEAVEAVIEVRRENGSPLPQELAEVEVA